MFPPLVALLHVARTRARHGLFQYLLCTIWQCEFYGAVGVINSFDRLARCGHEYNVTENLLVLVGARRIEWAAGCPEQTGQENDRGVESMHVGA